MTLVVLATIAFIWPVVFPDPAAVAAFVEYAGGRHFLRGEKEQLG